MKSTIEFRLSAEAEQFAAEFLTSQGFFLFLDSTSLQSIVTSCQPSHSLSPKSACLLRFSSSANIFFAPEEELPGGLILCWTLGPIFRRSPALKLNSCHLLGDFDLFLKSVHWRLCQTRLRHFLQRFSRAANKVGFSTQRFGTVGGGALL